MAVLLKELRNPLAGSPLFSCVTEASRLCAGIFEKAYLSKLAARLVGNSSPNAELLGIAAELAMFSALSVDDWVDQTQFRSGRAALHTKYGPATAVFAAACLSEAAHEAVRQACSELSTEQRSEIERAFSRAFLGIQAGQAMMEQTDAVSATPAILDRLARLRCGRLIGFAMGSAAWLMDNNSAAKSLAAAGTWIGIALQYRNDIQDFTVTFDQNIKPPLADLLAGQPNLVVGHLVRNTDRLSISERKLLAGLLGRSKLIPNAPVTRDEFNAVMHMVAQTGAGALAADQLARCICNAERLLAREFSNNLLDEWKDYALLLQQP